MYYLRPELAPLRPVELLPEELPERLDELVLPVLREADDVLVPRVLEAELVLRLPETDVLRLLDAPFTLVLDDPDVLTLLLTVVRAALLADVGVPVLRLPEAELAVPDVPVLREETVLPDAEVPVLLCAEADVLLEEAL